MDILTDEQIRVLRYIQAANRGGVRPTQQQVKEWRHAPGRKDAVPGKLLQSARPGTPDRRVPKTSLFSGFSHAMDVSKMLTPMDSVTSISRPANIPLGFKGPTNVTNSLIASNLWGFETIPGTPARPAKYAKGTPREGFMAHMRRLGWVTRDDSKAYEVSELGLALLRAHETPNEDSDVLVLGGDDQALDYSKAIDHISGHGEAMLVDAYLGIDQIKDLLQYTSVTRFLVSDHKKTGKRKVGLGVYLKNWKKQNDDSIIELRAANLHDRWIVGAADFHLLGASLNGIGKYTTTLTRVRGDAGGELRKQAENLWAKAEVEVAAAL